MNDKKIKEAIQQYIETKADNMLSETEERHDLSSLDEKVSMQRSVQSKTNAKRPPYGLLRR